MFLRPNQIKRELAYSETPQSVEAMAALRRAEAGREVAALFSMQNVEIDEDVWLDAVERLAKLRDAYDASPEAMQDMLEHHNRLAFYDLDLHEWTFDTRHRNYWENWAGPTMTELYRERVGGRPSGGETAIVGERVLV